MWKFVVMILLTLSLAACALSEKQQSREADLTAQMAVYDRHAGAAENWVRYTRIRDWWPVGFNHVVLETGPSRYHLVELMGSCDLRIDRARSLRLISQRNNTLSEQDRVVVDGHSCGIRSLRRLDYAAVRNELEQEAQAEKRPVEIRVEPAD